jgi:hypothetical protein
VAGVTAQRAIRPEADPTPELGTGSEKPSFFDLYSDGMVEADAIEQWVGRWHDGVDPIALGRELYDYLGLSLPEYKLWVYHPGALRCIREARRSGQVLDEAVRARLAGLTSVGSDADPTVVRGLRIWLDAATEAQRYDHKPTVTP